MPGLSVSDVVNVQINMSPRAVPLRNFGALCIAGPSNIIDVKERLREYTTLDGVAEDFGSSSPEFLAADLFFSQSPQPSLLYVGRFAQTSSAAILHGAIMLPKAQASLLALLQGINNGTFKISIDGTERVIAATPGTLNSGAFSPTEQDTLLTTLKATVDGAFTVTIDGTIKDLAPIDFADITGPEDAADLINAGLGPEGEFEWNTNIGTFVLRSLTTGPTSSVTYASAPPTGTNISGLLKLTSATGATPPAPGGSGMNFTNITNLNGAATVITNALHGAGCWWDGVRFHIEATSAGPTSSISYASPAGTGTDVSNIMGLSHAGGALPPVDGIEAESPLDCAIALRAHPEWYGLTFATIDPIADADYVAVAEFIEGANPISIFGYTTQKTSVLDTTVTDDLPSQMKGLNLERTFGQFSSSSPYAVCSMYGRAFTVDFEASTTMITLKFKVEPGVQAEYLTENQATALRHKNCNVFVYYSNDAAIIQEGVMANGFFFDEVQGTDWQANRIQTDLFNVLYTAPTKIPQTNQGIHILVATVENSLSQGVVNGLIAPGQWNAPGFGQIAFGQMLPKGYYVWAPLVETQPQAIREQRIAPTIQAAIKLAGAVHKANVIVNVNR